MNVDDHCLGIDKCIKRFETHPSIINIRSNVKVDSKFHFLPVTTEYMDEQLLALDPKKNGGCIPTKQLKEMHHIVSNPLAAIWNTEVLRKKYSLVN